MELDIFNAHKQGIRERMQENLIWDRHHQNFNRPSSLAYEIKEVSIMFDEAPKSVQGRMEYIAKCIGKGYEVSLSEISKHQYCSTYMIGTKYTIVITHIADFVSDKAVEVAMKELVALTLKVNLEVDYFTASSIDCRVMELYRAGKITWTDVVIAHQEDCQF